MVDGHDWSQVFNEIFSTPPSAVQARIWSQVLGAEYPGELQPYSYVTRSELSAFVTHLQVGESSLLLDLGCGRGGPGLWIAATAGTSIRGVDIAAPALAEARRVADSLGFGDRASYVEGTFESIPVEDSSADAIMSIDALLFTPDKSAAAVEMARVIRPGGRLVATTWDYHSQPAGRPPQVADHRPLLVNAGFDVLSYDETPGWESFQRRTDALMLEAIDELAEESGEDPDEIREDLREMDASMDAMLRRVLIVAVRGSN